MTKRQSIRIKNIYYMLSYAFRSLKSDEYKDVAAERFEHIHDLLAAILATGIGTQLKQGLHREYVTSREDLTTMRGRIDMAGTVKRRMARQRKLTCEYDELSPNNLINQIVKSAAILLLRHGDVRQKHHDDLKKRMMFFADVDDINPAAIPWSRVRLTRSNQAYRMLVGICRLVVDGMLLTTEKGENRLTSFVDDQRMSALYEKFILEYYRHECTLAAAEPRQITWALDDDARSMLPTMQSDVMLSRADTVLIIDAKYYSRNTQEQFDKRTVHSQNLYQIFTYVKNKDMELRDRPRAVAGMLLYARTDDAIQPDATYHMSGNQISVRTLDLSAEFNHIAAQLDAIAAEHFTTAQSRAANAPLISPRP